MLQPDCSDAVSQLHRGRDIVDIYTSWNYDNSNQATTNLQHVMLKKSSKSNLADLFDLCAASQLLD